MPATTCSWPWWQTCLLVAGVAMALTAFALYLPPGRATVVLLVGALVFAWFIQKSPAFWLRRLAGACISAAVVTAAVPAISAALDLGPLGSLRFHSEGAAWFALGFLVAAVALAALEVWRERPAPQPAEPRESPPAPASHARQHFATARDVDIHPGGENIAGDKNTTHNAPVIHNHAPVTHHHHAPVTPPPAGFDLQRHLARLLPDVDHINITGIRSRPGASRDALRRPIEELYTPLRSHRPRSPEAMQRPPDVLAGEDPESHRVELPELLREHHRLLLEGQPGSGKTTFINLVACMHARDLAYHSPPPGAASWREKHLGLAGPARIPGLVRIAALVQLLLKHRKDDRGDEHRWLLHLLALRTCPEEKLELDHRDPGHERRCREWDELLQRGDALVLLDGLDEAADEELRERIFMIFRIACDRWKRAPILVTSRPIQTGALLRMGFHRATIDPFEPPQIERFVQQWASALHENTSPETSAREAQVLLRALEQRQDLRDLASNPVMLTCLCVVHWNEGGLPEGRARVYHAVFHWMLRSREEQREAAGYSSEFARYAFPSLALAMMTGAGGKRARIDLWEAAAALDADVAREYPDEKDRLRWAKTWLTRECEWSHIIEEVEDDELKFWHLTMQEFAAALALAQRSDEDGWPIVREHLGDPQWRETLALLPGCLYDDGGRARIDRFVARVLDNGETGGLLPAARSVGLLGRVLPTLRAYKYKLPPPPPLGERLRALQARAVGIFAPEGAEVPAYVRIAAAEALEAAGFPPPANEFIELPGKGVALAKYSVTVGEFAAFVDAGGYGDDTNWDAEGLRFREQEGWTRPRGWDDQRERPNRPVTGVSWHEARAYCRWLVRRIGRAVRLPTVEEWTFAAAPDGREFPWGGKRPTEEHANFNRHIGEPTPVGAYPAGAGRFGHHDLAGNVWEWCEEGEPEPDAERRRRWGNRHWIRGGSWIDEGWALAAAFHYWIRSRHRNGDCGFRVVASASRVEP